MENKCSTCDWYAKFDGVCMNGDSEFRGDFKCLDDTCKEWEEKTDDRSNRGYENKD